MSLLEWEKRLIADDMDLYSRMENVGCSQHSYFALQYLIKFQDCEVDLKQHEVSLGKTEEIKQLQREKEGLELDIDIIKQLKVEIKLMKCETKNLITPF